jgi:Mn2+/Fe2+ NRAMP family transporter
MVVAVLGTTISPYLFFWQAAQEAEQRQRMDRTGGWKVIAPTIFYVREHLYRIKLDTTVGMCFSNVIAFCVISPLLTLHAHGGRTPTTAQAAEALRPLAGELAFTLFALGIIGTGMLAVPVLAASSGYAVADALQWRSGLDNHLLEARGFYFVIGLGTLIGTLMDFTALDPIKALVWSAVVNGVIAVPIMAVMMWLGTKRELLGDYSHLVHVRAGSPPPLWERRSSPCSCCISSVANLRAYAELLRLGGSHALLASALISGAPGGETRVHGHIYTEREIALGRGAAGARRAHRGRRHG